jgi:tetratricopeptide (TPR) repeat protein
LRLAIAIEPRTAPAYLALSLLPWARRPSLWKEVQKENVPPDWVPQVEEAYRLRRRAFLLDPLVDLKPLGLAVPPRDAIVIGRNASTLYAALVVGYENFWDGRYDQAYNRLNEVIAGLTPEQQKELPDWFYWYHGLASAHVLQYSAAIIDFRLLLDHAIARVNTDSLNHSAVPFTNINEWRYELGVMMDNGGRTGDAVALFQEALANDLGLYVAHTRLARIYDDQHRPNQALDERRRAVDANPDDPSLLFDLGEALARAGRLADAQGVLRQARLANPRNARAVYVLGFVAQQLESKEEARECYARFLEIAPSRFGAQLAEARKQLAALQ